MKFAEVSLANLLWASALASVSLSPVEQLLAAHREVLAEAKSAELARLLWALGALTFGRHAKRVRMFAKNDML